MGVEPTKDRLAVPPGFEVRTPHRGRFSSLIRYGRNDALRRWAEQVEPVLVHAAQVAATQRHAVAIKKFENLDSYLAAVVDLVAELRGSELALVRDRTHAADDLHHLGNGVAQEEMVVRHLVDLAHARHELHQAPHISFGNVEQSGDVAHARWAKSLRTRQERRHARPRALV